MLSDFPPDWAGRGVPQSYFVLSCFMVQGERERGNLVRFSAKLVVSGTGVGITWGLILIPLTYLS